MKAYVYLEKGKTGWVDKPRPEPGLFDAVVRLTAVSPCSSDVHNVEYGYLKKNIVIGHEGIGVIEKVGPEVKDFKPGDKVIIPAVTPDWRTTASQKGASQHFNGLLSGNIISVFMDGLLAEYALIPDADANLAHMPEGMDPLSAVFLGDMVTTGFYGAELADVQFGDTVVVIGIGPVGLMAVAGAKLRGAGRIIAVGSRPVCVEAAKFYGASEVISYKDGDIAKQVYKLTNKKGADRCIIAGGSDEVLGQAVTMLRPGGTIGSVNYFQSEGDLSFPNSRYGYGMSNKSIHCGLTPGGRARMEALSDMVTYNRVDPSKLATHVFEGIDYIDNAFELMRKKPADLIKPVVLL